MRRRLTLNDEQRSSAARHIASHLEPLLHDGVGVAAFSATRNEVDLSALYTTLLDREIPLFFPRVVGKGLMVFARIQELQDLQPGAFGIGEPAGPASDLSLIDRFLVPGLAFDRRGARLGFGGGYYDRALASVAEDGAEVPLLVGIGYTWQVLDTELPTDEWDVPLTHVVTESGVMPCDGGISGDFNA